MTFNKNIVALSGSASMELMQKADILKAAGHDVLNLAGGEPDFTTPPKICEAAERAICSGMTHYAVGKGIPALREKISEKLVKENKIKCNTDNIIVTPGGKFGIYMAVCSIINHGDEVIIFNPSWVSYAPIVMACGGIPISVDLDYAENYKINEKKLHEKITDKTKAIIINYPNNPTGKVLSSKEAEILIREIVDKDIFIIADEIYEKIVFNDNKNISIASYKEIENKVITINGFSKCAAMTGWRLGYVAADSTITDQMYKLYTHTITGTSPFLQTAALEVFNCEDEIENMRRVYEMRRNFLVKELNEIDGISCRLPEGTFYAWVKFNTDESSVMVAENLLLQCGIIGVPGVSYGESNSCCMRFSFACKEDILKRAVVRMNNYKI